MSNVVFNNKLFHEREWFLTCLCAMTVATNNHFVCANSLTWHKQNKETETQIAQLDWFVTTLCAMTIANTL